MRRSPAELENERERRRQYRDRLAVKDPDGGTAGVAPRDLPRALITEVHTPSPLLDVMREKCLDCSCYQPSEIAKCTAVACSLWPYRMGANPFSNRKGNASALQTGRSRSAVPVQAEEISTDDEARYRGAPEPVIAPESSHGKEAGAP
jgi:hypothetical protein